MNENRFFKYFKEEQLEAVRLELTYVTLQPNEAIFHAGDLGDACYLIDAGSVRVTVPGSSGMEETVAILGPNDFFGELALYHSAPRIATVTAVQETRLGRLDRDAFERLRQLAPLEIASALAEVNIERVRRTNSTMISELAAAGKLREVGGELTTIAHNLRSPLATVQSAAEVVLEFLDQEPAPREKIVKFVEIIHSTAMRALQSTDVLLAGLRGEQRAPWLPMKVSAVVAGAEQQLSGKLARSGAALTIDVQTRRQVRVQGAELEAALVNLLCNSLEALPEGDGVVALTAKDAKDTVVFTVSDNGCGIPPEAAGRIFESRFTHGKPGGTGLGLAHTRAVAERHGGYVELVESSERGTTFRLVVPAYEGS